MPPDRWKSVVRKVATVLGLLVYAGVVFLVFAAARYVLASTPAPVNAKGQEVFNFADRISISLNALGLSLLVITLFVGALAVFGWDKLEKVIRRDVEDSLKARITALETLMEGRVVSMLGFAIGELSSEPDRMEATNRDRLSEAVQHCQRGYELLKEAGKRRPMLMGLNNLVYYSSIYGERSKGRQLLEQARTLRDAGYELDRPRLLLTYCRAVLRYSTDPKQREEAGRIVGELLSGQLSDQERKEAKFYLASFSPPTPS
jgi:hypothetical protein